MPKPPKLAEGDTVVCTIAGALQGVDQFTALVVTAIDGKRATLASITGADLQWTGVDVRTLVKVA
jgi:hypothetical protein